MKILKIGLSIYFWGFVLSVIFAYGVIFEFKIIEKMKNKFENDKESIINEEKFQRTMKKFELITDMAQQSIKTLLSLLLFCALFSWLGVFYSLTTYLYYKITQ